MDLRQSWDSGDTDPCIKATAKACSTYPTTQQLYQGAGDAGKARPETSFTSATPNLHLERRVAGSNPEWTLHLHLQSGDNDCIYTMCPFCKPAGLLNFNCNV